MKRDILEHSVLKLSPSPCCHPCLKKWETCWSCTTQMKSKTNVHWFQWVSTKLVSPICQSASSVGIYVMINSVRQYIILYMLKLLRPFKSETRYVYMKKKYQITKKRGKITTHSPITTKLKINGKKNVDPTRRMSLTCRINNLTFVFVFLHVPPSAS